MKDNDLDIKDDDFKDLNFEEAINRLQEIVDKLEAGGLSLDESLGKFTEGVKLVKFCNKELNKAEKKIEIVLKDEEEFTDIVSFQDEEEQ